MADQAQPPEKRSPTWKISDRVRVLEPRDEIGDPRYIGHTGSVTALGFEECDVGATSSDPLVVVTFDRPVWLRHRVALVTDGEVETLPGFSVNEHDGFWSEELETWL